MYSHFDESLNRVGDSTQRNENESVRTITN